MLLMGDEVRRTQRGNDNAYCQDNETSWFDWDLCTIHTDILRFEKLLIRMRLAFDSTIEGGRISLEEFLTRAHIEWHGVELGKPDWGRDSHSLAFTLHSFTSSQVHHILINAYWQPFNFELPPLSGDTTANWLRVIDTSLESPNDIVEAAMCSRVLGPKYCVNPRSFVVLQYNYAMVDQTGSSHKP